MHTFTSYGVVMLLRLTIGAAASMGFNWDTWMSRILRYNVTAQHAALSSLRDAGVSRVKIFAADPGLIAGISDIWGSRSLQMMIAVTNQDLAALAHGQKTFDKEKLDALMDTLSSYSDRIEFIAVGNEVEYPAVNNKLYAPLLLPVLETLHSELERRGLGHVRLTCPFSDVMIISAGNPSEADFLSSYDSALSCNEKWCMDHSRIPMLKWVLPALNFLNRTNGAFATTVYPFYKWRNLVDPVWCTRPGYGPCIDESLAFSVGAPGAAQQLDTHSGLHYDSSLSMMIDAALSALAKHGYSNLQFIVAETGWPSSGIEHTSTTASCWYTNTVAALVKHGTPASNQLGAKTPIIYHFQWVDELGKYDFLGQPQDPGLIEDHFGVLDSGLRQKYPLDLVEGKASCPAMPASAYKSIPHTSLQEKRPEELHNDWVSAACLLFFVGACLSWVYFVRSPVLGRHYVRGEPLLAA